MKLLEAESVFLRGQLRPTSFSILDAFRQFYLDCEGKQSIKQLCLSLGASPPSYTPPNRNTSTSLLRLCAVGRSSRLMLSSVNLTRSLPMTAPIDFLGLASPSIGFGRL
jgi:hypothetical protein